MIGEWQSLQLRAIIPNPADASYSRNWIFGYAVTGPESLSENGERRRLAGCARHLAGHSSREYEVFLRLLGEAISFFSQALSKPRHAATT